MARSVLTRTSPMSSFVSKGLTIHTSTPSTGKPVLKTQSNTAKPGRYPSRDSLALLLFTAWRRTPPSLLNMESPVSHHFILARCDESVPTFSCTDSKPVSAASCKRPGMRSIFGSKVALRDYPFLQARGPRHQGRIFESPVSYCELLPALSLCFQIPAH